MHHVIPSVIELPKGFLEFFRVSQNPFPLDGRIRKSISGNSIFRTISSTISSTTNAGAGKQRKNMGQVQVPCSCHHLKNSKRRYSRPFAKRRSIIWYSIFVSTAQGTKLIRKIAKTKLRGNGSTYLMVGRKTFSSAIINSVDLIKEMNAVVVGEETGGRPNHFGEVDRFVLPESRLVVSYSTKYFKLLDEDIPSIIPDIPAPLTYSQYMSGTDPALEVILNHRTR